MSVITAPPAPTTRAGTPQAPSRQLRRALKPGTIGKVIVLLVAAFLTLGPVDLDGVDRPDPADRRFGRARLRV